MTLCNCGTIKNYTDCCGMYITNSKLPQTPEELMRSRYTAYANCNIEYIAKTMCDKALKGFNLKSVKLWARHIKWLKLEVLDQWLISESIGFVEFKAYYLEENISYILHEKSEFHNKNNRWFYVDGIIINNTKLT